MLQPWRAQKRSAPQGSGAQPGGGCLFRGTGGLGRARGRAVPKLAAGAVCALFFCMLLAAPARSGAIEKIKSRGYLVAGVMEGAAPFGFVDPGSGALVGFDVAICASLSEKLGVDLKLKPVTPASRIPMLAQGSVDLLAATLSHTFAREESIDFSITYFETGQKLLVERGSGIASAEDLAGRKVGTAKGSTAAENIKKAQPECDVAAYETASQAFQALREGDVSAVTSDVPLLLGLKSRSEQPERWVVVGSCISHEPYGLGVPEDDSDFRDFVNRALADMWNSGEYRTIFRKWFGPESDTPLALDWQMQVWPY